MNPSTISTVHYNKPLFRSVLLGIIICVLLSANIYAKHHSRKTDDITNNNKARETLKTGTERAEGEDTSMTISTRSSIGKSESTSFTKTHRRNQVVVSTKSGKVRGKWAEVNVQTKVRKVAMFLGIPYGKSPTGKLRFKKSHPVRKWRGIRNTLRYPPSCYQWRDNTFGEGYPGTEMWNPNTNLSEDCLFLNIWTPIKLNSTSETNNLRRKYPLPVMVWIYGGGFYSGTSSLDVYDGKWLAATEQVIVVSFNYRVAAFGFLSFGVKEAPGNAGLWDQNLALKWIQRNIKQFGGDENRVTLFGESAGAASVSAHILSNHSRGLFQNAILQSASILSPWAVHPLLVMQKRAKKLATLLGCGEENGNTTRTEKDMVACLYDADPQKVVDTEIAMEDVGTAQFQNAAVIDGHFLSGEELSSLQSGEFSTGVNILFGFNGNEGNYFLVYGSPGFNIKRNNSIDYAQYRSGLSRSLRIYSKTIEPNKFPPLAQAQIDAINFEFTDYEEAQRDEMVCKHDSTNETCKETKDKKFASENTGKNYKVVLDHVVGETSFVCPTINFIRKILTQDAATKTFSADFSPKRGKKFLYQFLHRSSQTPWPKWMGVLHGYEIEFVFGIPHNTSLPYTAEEYKLSRQMMMYWANFARNGDPNAEENQSINAPEKELIYWPEYTLEKQESLVLSIEPVTPNNHELKVSTYVKEKTKTRHCTFWRSYFPGIREEYENTRKHSAPSNAAAAHMLVTTVLVNLTETTDADFNETDQYAIKQEPCIARTSRSPGNSVTGKFKLDSFVHIFSVFLAFHGFQIPMS